MKIETKKISDLQVYTDNAKLHPDWQVKQIEQSIKKFGMNQPIALWHDDNGNSIVVSGHGRLAALKELGETTAPCIYLDHLSEAQRKAYALIDNQTTMNTAFDQDKLLKEIESVEGEINLDDFGFDIPSMEDFGFDDVEDTKPSEKIKITLSFDNDSQWNKIHDDIESIVTSAGGSINVSTGD